jgi:ArsR family transcriptional regulator
MPSYRRHLGTVCERFGFEPSHLCQLEVHHVDLDRTRATIWARKFKILADPTRVAILVALAGFSSARVSELTSAFDLSQPTVSHHLRLLREAGFVSCVREGTCSSYRLVPETMEPFQALLRAA